MTSNPRISQDVLDLIDSCLAKSGEGEQFLEEARQKIRQRCKDDLWFLAYHVLAAGHNRDTLKTDLHRDMCERWNARNHRLYTIWLCPRLHLKTTLFTVAGNIQEVLRDPDVRILIINASLSKAFDIMSEIKTHFDANELLRWLFPEYCLDLCPNRKKAELCTWTGHRIDFPAGNRPGKREGNIECFGVEMSLVSKHYDVLHFDDCVNDKNISTKEYRDKVFFWFKSSFQLRDNPIKSRIRIIGTIWHFDDVVCRIINEESKRRKIGKKPRWLIYKRSAIENGQPLWHERFSLKHLEDLREEVGSYLWGCNFMNNPVLPESAIFKMDKIKIVEDYEVPDIVVNFAAVDLAEEESIDGDFTVVSVASFDVNGNMYVRQVWRGKIFPLEVFNLLKFIQEVWNPARVGVESVGFQKTFLKYYKQTAVDEGVYIPFVEIKRGQASKFKRALGFQPLVERGQFHIVNGIENTENIIEELTTFPSGVHDDIVDTLVDLYTVCYKANPQDTPVSKQPTYDNVYGSLFEEGGDYLQESAILNRAVFSR